MTIPGRLAYPTWSPDGRSIWFGARSPGGEGGIYEVAATGGKERMIVRVDDPSRQIASYSFTVRRGRIYLCMTETESDVYVAELGQGGMATVYLAHYVGWYHHYGAP